MSDEVKTLKAKQRRAALLAAVDDAEFAAEVVPCTCDHSGPFGEHAQECWKPRLERAVELVREQVK